MAYSDDYRKRAIEYKDSGHTFEELREALKIPPRTYYDWKQKFADGYYGRKIKRQRRRKIDREKLAQAVAEKPDAYLRELAQQFSCTATAVFYMLKKLGITLKKKPSPIARSPRRSAGNEPDLLMSKEAS